MTIESVFFLLTGIESVFLMETLAVRRHAQHKLCSQQWRGILWRTVARQGNGNYVLFEKKDQNHLSKEEKLEYQWLIQKVASEVLREPSSDPTESWVNAQGGVIWETPCKKDLKSGKLAVSGKQLQNTEICHLNGSCGKILT